MIKTTSRSNGNRIYAASEKIFMNKQIDISIVIVTYNNADILLTCLKSLSQSLAKYSAQVIIIDNASSDGTAELLRDNTKWLTSGFYRVRSIFNSSNTGYTHGVNQGLSQCDGRFILLLNPDVILMPATITVLVNRLISSKSSGIVAPQLRFADGTVQPSCRRFPRKRDVLYEILLLRVLFPDAAWLNHWQMTDFDHRSSRDVDQPQGAFLLLKHQVLRDTGFFDERFFMFFSDVDWCHRVRQKGWNIRFCAETCAVHLKGASISKERAKMIVSSHRSFLQYLQKYERKKFGVGLFIIHVILLVILIPRILLAKLNLNQG